MINITKGRVSDGIEMEKSLKDSECGQAIATLTQYNTDIDVNNAIDSNDLIQIAKYMLANPKYNNM